MSWYTDNIARFKEAVAVADGFEDKKAAYLYALESAHITKKLALPKIHEEYEKLLTASPLKVQNRDGKEYEFAAGQEKPRAFLDIYYNGIAALESFSAYAIALEIQEDGDGLFTNNENNVNGPLKGWVDHIKNFNGDIEQLIKLIEKAFPIVDDPVNKGLPEDAKPKLKDELRQHIEQTSAQVRTRKLADYFANNASQAEQAVFNEELARVAEQNKNIERMRKHQQYFLSKSLAEQESFNQLIKQETDRLIKKHKEEALDEYLAYATDPQHDEFRAKYLQYKKLKPYREILLERAKSAKAAAQFLTLLKDFQLHAFRGEHELALAKLADIQASIAADENNRALYCNQYTITVFAKLLQVKARINAQFGDSKYDDPTQANRLSNLVDNFQAKISRDANPKLVERINDVKNFVEDDFKKSDVYEYTPWFLPRFFRWVASFFRTKSDYKNDNSTKQAWSMFSSDINAEILPTYVESGVTGEQQLKRNNSSISKKLKAVLAPANQQVQEIVKDINSHLALFGDKLNGLLQGGERSKFKTSHITQAQAAHVAKIMADDRILTSFVSLKSFMRSFDDVHLTTEETNLLHKVAVPYPKWPDAPLSYEVLNNAAQCKNYAAQLARCIREAYLHGDAATRSILINQLCKFLIPALFHVGDVINIKSGYYRGNDNFAGLKFYKELFNQLFKTDLPNPVGNANEALLWGKIKALKTTVFDAFNEETNEFNLSAVVAERQEQKRVILQEAKNLSKLIWSYQALNLPKIVNFPRYQIEPERFYLEFSDVRRRLRELICETNVGNTPERDAKNKEDIQLLQHYQDNETYHDDCVDKILNHKIYNSDGTERTVQPLVRLLAALNALANQFLKCPSFGRSYQTFFTDPTLSLAPQMCVVEKYITRNNSFNAGDLPADQKRLLDEIGDKLKKFSGMQIASLISSPVVKSPVSKGGVAEPLPASPSTIARKASADVSPAGSSTNLRQLTK